MRYKWVDTNTGVVVIVERKLAQIELPPFFDEIEQYMLPEELADANWVRIVDKAPAFTGPKQKGNY